MNSIDKKPNYKKIYQIARNRFDKTTHFKHGPYDETYYTLRVYESAKEIIKRLNKKVKVQQVLVASILHDIGKTKLKSSRIFGQNAIPTNASEEWQKHAKLGVPISKNILKKLGHSENFIAEVAYLIKNHDLRRDKIKEKSIELQILQDADLIADCGFAGFIRPFLYCGKFNSQSIIGAINYIKKEENRVEKEGMLNLNISKKIAKSKIQTEKKLIEGISKEIDSALL